MAIIIIIFLIFTPAIMIPGAKAKLKTNQWNGHMSGSLKAAKSCRQKELH